MLLAKPVTELFHSHCMLLAKQHDFSDGRCEWWLNKHFETVLGHQHSMNGGGAHMFQLVFLVGMPESEACQCLMMSIGCGPDGFLDFQAMNPFTPHALGNGNLKIEHLLITNIYEPRFGTQNGCLRLIYELKRCQDQVQPRKIRQPGSTRPRPSKHWTPVVGVSQFQSTLRRDCQSVLDHHLWTDWHQSCGLPTDRKNHLGMCLVPSGTGEQGSTLRLLGLVLGLARLDSHRLRHK